MPLSGIELSAGIVVGSNKPVEAKYGPYATTDAALADIGSTLRYKGLTVGIEVSGKVVEYWFRDGTTDSDLIAKNPATFIGSTPPSPAVNGTLWIDSATYRIHALRDGIWAEISTA